jgi:hypothetical protein
LLVLVRHGSSLFALDCWRQQAQHCCVIYSFALTARLLAAYCSLTSHAAARGRRRRKWTTGARRLRLRLAEGSTLSPTLVYASVDRREQLGGQPCCIDCFYRRSSRSA